MYKSLTFAITLASLLTASIFCSHTAPSAAAKVTITTNKTFKKTSFLPNTNKNVYVWNAKYNKKLHNLKNYPRTNLYATKRVTIKTHNYFGSYYDVQSANKKIKGYVWHGQLIQGKYYKGGFYRYPTLNVLLSNRRYVKGNKPGYWDASGIYSYANRINGTINKEHLQAFTKTPSFSDQKKVLTYLEKDRPYLPKMLNYGNHNGARIVMRRTKTKVGQSVRVPMIDILNDRATGNNWEEINSFASVLDLAKLPNGGKPIATYDVNKTSVIPFGGRQFDFPDPNAQFSAAANGPITHIYGNDFGPDHNLSLVDQDRWLRYVPTSNILKLSNTQPTFKDGIWYYPATFQNDVSYSKYDQKMLSQMNPSESQYYRYVTPLGFYQYHYENGEWHGQYQAMFFSNQPTPNGQVILTFAKLVTKSDAYDTWVAPENPHDIHTFSGNDATVLPYLYKPVSYYDAFVK